MSDQARVTSLYRELNGLNGHGVDELLARDGSPHARSADLAATVDLLGVPGLVARRAQADRLVEDEGVTYGTAPTGPDGEPLRTPASRWAVDPLPVVIDREAWQALEPAIAQRAELMDRVLADLYGPRELLRRGLVPAEVVFGHIGYVRQADGIRLPGPRQLFLHAADLARDSSGRWCVLGDRTQAPSGAGYAMENRRIVSRIMPGLYRDSGLLRLRTFFHTVRAALQEVAPATAEAPRVVLLTPGPGSETAFDQAFLSTLLGYPLVTGEDLTVRSGRVFMRSLGKLEPVDVVLRRVDAWFADPLELRPDSRLGVAGLLEAGRQGNVSVVNGFGSGVLENPGLLPFLPAVARALLDQDLLLPSAPTWWCGDPASRRLVLGRLEQLVVKPLSQGVTRASRFGWELSGRQLDDLCRRIEAEPLMWCAQEPVEMSTAPVVTRAGLEPRRLTLRTFAVAQGGRYHVLAGGLGRVADRPSSHLVSNASGAVAKDVWVLAGSDQGEWAADLAPRPVLLAAAAGEYVSAAPTALPPRVGENLFWLGRYAERAEDAVRLLRVVDDLAEDWSLRPATVGWTTLRIMLETLTRATATFPGFVGPGAEDLLAAPRRELLALVVDATRPGTLAYAVRRTVEAAHAVREQLSLDTWIVLGSLDRVLDELAQRVEAGAGFVAADEPALQPVLARVLEGLLALAGLGAESMVRDAGWYLMDAGRRLERALQVLALLRHTLVREQPPAVEHLVLESVLIAGESIITHRRRHQGRAQPATVLDLLLLDRHNPRSVALQLDRLAEDLRHLPGNGPASTALPGRLRETVALLRETDSMLAGQADPDGSRPQLAQALDAVLTGLSDLGLAMELAHFAPLSPPRPIAATPGWDA